MVKRFLSVFFLCLLVCLLAAENSISGLMVSKNESGEDYIKWVDFDLTYEALEDAMTVDIETYEQDLHIGWVDILAYLGTKYGGNFSQYRASDMDALVEALESGSSMENLTKEMTHYSYYHKAYEAVIGNFLGMREDGTYGLTAYSPVAAGYWYTESDDFGNGRSYGFARKHLGHDMFCSVGTPVAAVEKGRVEALGWNQYGGWRIGIRSNDGLRYYYYAHLRKDNPYIEGLKIGDQVDAGQIIGYSGQTGYSIKENVNNINVPHLHFGMQLVFDESQKECNAEIWIDTYALIRLLSKNRAEVKTASAAVSASVTDAVDVPILMYHGLTRKASQVNDYFIPVEVFESDLQYLKENGYTAVTMTELIDFVYDETGTVTLPEKPVVLTFDDGFYNNYALGSPLLEKYGMKAVISVIGHACEKESTVEYHSEDYCEVTWAQVQRMASSGLWEIQNHTWDLHDYQNGRKGASKKSSESVEGYEALLVTDLGKLQKKIEDVTGVLPNTFTWPYGAYTEDSRNLLKSMGFKATLSCLGGINVLEKGDTEGLFLLKRNLRKPGVDIENLLN